LRILPLYRHAGGGVGGRGWWAVCGAAATNTEVERAGLGAVCGGDEYGGQATGVELPWSRRAWFSGARAVYTPPLIVSRDMQSWFVKGFFIKLREMVVGGFKW
jgi:hypothetical protein